MLHWLFLSLKYQIWPLPKDPAELRKLAIDLQITLAYSWKGNGLNTLLVQSAIRERLKSFRRDAPYVVLFIVPIFSVIVLLAYLLAWISQIPSGWDHPR